METTVDFWKGAFGDEYGRRNRPKWQDRVPFWRQVVENTEATSFLDVGTNAGWNLLALRSLSGEYVMSGVDVNKDALTQAANEGLDVLEGRADQVAELFGTECADMVITSGVLIHIAPDDLTAAMTAIKNASKRWVVAIEYEADTEQEVDYRGHSGKLWKRPYGKLYEALGLSLVEFGVAQGFDQCHYWLLEKT